MTVGSISAFPQLPKSGTGTVAVGLWDTHLSVGHEYPWLCPAESCMGPGWGARASCVCDLVHPQEKESRRGARECRIC